MTREKVIILDVDHTLTVHNSWTELTRALGASTEDHLELHKSLIDHKIELDEANRRLVRLWQHTGKANRDFVDRTFREMPLKTEARLLVEWLALNGYRTCLISGSMDRYVSAVAAHLGIQDWFANGRLLFDEQDQLVGLKYRPDQSVVKLEQLRELCAHVQVDTTDTVVVGDGENDLNIFKETRRGILVSTNPIPDLQRAAWMIVPNLRDIPAILEANSTSPSTH
ncbi:HAD family phosphatase [Amycolatopsis sp.]|uniref:HAD family hydrolase n=1 Tax=Amycolatopsis sp. TaxID=37632 RepID=UPI00260DFF73|nr:HAD-IB family phosphatase [Amycolatopsis sp.]